MQIPHEGGSGAGSSVDAGATVNPVDVPEQDGKVENTCADAGRPCVPIKKMKRLTRKARKAKMPKESKMHEDTDWDNIH